MLEPRSKRKETEDVARVDALLKLLGDVSKHDPSDALRDRLSVLASERLNHNLRHPGLNPRMWPKSAFAAICLVAAGIAMALAVHYFEHGIVQNGGTAKSSPLAVSPESRTRAVPEIRPTAAKPSKVRHSRVASLQPTGPQQMTMRLPYSNSAIQTGTGTTIRVSMSQSELRSLGFPISETVQDRRIVAQLTLGDDGLPRAISLPLPLEVMKERK